MAGRRRISAKQLKALARGRKTAMANRRAKKKTGARAHPRTTRKKAPMRRNPSASAKRAWEKSYTRGALWEHVNNLQHFVMAPPLVTKAEFLRESPANQKSLYDWLYREAGTFASVMEVTRPTRRKKPRPNPAYGNFMNAMAAKERGDLGRGAYQNPVRPLKKKPPGDYMVMRGLRYWTGYGFSEKRALAARYASVKAAAVMAQKLATKTNTPVKVVLAARHLK